MTDLSALKSELAVVGAKKEELFANKQAVSTQIVSAINKIKEHKQKRDELTSQVKVLKVKRDELNASLKSLFAELKTHTVDSPKIDPSKRVNVGFVKKQIAELQYKIETSGMTFEDEKKNMKKIKELQKQIGDSDKFSSTKVEVREISKKIDTIKTESDALHVQIQSMASASQKEHESILALSNQIDTLRVQEKDLTTQATNLKAAFKEQQTKVSAVATAMQATTKSSEAKEAVEHQAKQKVTIEKKVADVEAKIKNKKKLTTEDLLVMQSRQD